MLVSAAHKSSGKTAVSVGLAAALTARGQVVQTFKKGPDYIDPMWLALASRRPCYNLDFNTQTRDEIRDTFARYAAVSGVAVIEGNKGLHDGVDLAGSDSTAALAKLLAAPTILVIDAEGMTRGVAPLLRGYQAFDPAVDIAGVILNRVGTPRQEGKLRAAVERYTAIPVLGAVPHSPSLMVLERHLGLTTPSEMSDRHVKIARLAAAVRDNVDLARMLEIAGRADEFVAGPEAPREQTHQGDITIAVARDAAFSFYYPDDLQALERAGARLDFFSPLGDGRLPRADALFIGGGFPETHMAALEANTAMRGEIRAAARAGLPIHAECGGLMYLSRSIAWHGETRQMAGVVPAETVMHERPQGRGLVVLEETGKCRWPKVHNETEHAAIPAHEFHYAALANLAPGASFAWRVVRGAGIDGKHDGIMIDNVLASFSHMRDTSRNRWAARFAAFVRARKGATEAAARVPAARAGRSRRKPH
ncbi:MAG: cobyrinate a,c-diamide synthase [Hyphomicrobiaceae bacterium]|nr:MAG: cobyrinate a,c-diamide synthase [Hyphomicrobiaceae bacterium]